MFSKCNPEIHLSAISTFGDGFFFEAFRFYFGMLFRQHLFESRVYFCALILLLQANYEKFTIFRCHNCKKNCLLVTYFTIILDLNAKGVILRAFDQFRVKSCIDFKPRDTEEYYLSFQNLVGCWSYVGRTFLNGQELSIDAGCDHIAIVEHTILHALGFYHEEIRHDRDDYVQINFDNVIAGQEGYFKKLGSDLSTTHNVSYDYLSVMHSGKNVLSNGNGSTIITKDHKFQNVIGQRLDMSPRDAQKLKLLYKCSKSYNTDYSNY
uniref:Metalloendopeptidase n=1 Tax=Poecilia latipinna TaxID=48699 RepID=A0A3B3TZ44_9TELE